MDFDTIMGIVLIASGIVFITYVVLWSRRTIDIIARKRLRSIREILSELKNGK